MKTFYFDHEPTFAECWDKCVYDLYDIEAFKKDLEKLYARLGINKNSKIIDVAAGAGFPALDLIKEGYDITCSDGTADQVELFNRKAAEAKIANKCRKAVWLQLPEVFPQQKYNLLMCRGNSFIYADGGWNKYEEPSPGRAFGNYRKTLEAFYDQLENGGWVHLDKFKDSELGHREKVGEVKVNDNPIEDLIFWTQRDTINKVRRAAMIRAVGEEARFIPNITYDLLGVELEQMMAEIGFTNIQKISLPSEKHFDVWIGQKIK